MAKPARNIDSVSVVTTDCSRLLISYSCGHTEYPLGLELMLDYTLLNLLPVLLVGLQKTCNQCPDVATP